MSMRLDADSNFCVKKLSELLKDRDGLYKMVIAHLFSPSSSSSKNYSMDLEMIPQEVRYNKAGKNGDM